MKKLSNDLMTNKYTSVWHENDDQIQFNAPHHFFVCESGLDPNDPTISIKPFAEFQFQKGPIKEAGVNGVNNEDLIAMVICRLEHFQQSEFRCRENAVAITKLEESLMWLRKLTIGRENRGVEGTYTI
jgi:hypothetical protein